MEVQDYRSLLNDPASRRYETYSYLAGMDANTIRKQVQSMLDKGWDVSIEHVEPGRSDRTYWYMWKLPLFGEWDLDTIMSEITACRTAYPGHLVKVVGYDKTRQTLGMAMVVHRA